MSDCRDKLSKDEGAAWSVLLLNVACRSWEMWLECYCFLRFLYSSSVCVLKEGRLVFFQGIAGFNMSTYATIITLLAEYILVALNDYSPLLYVQDSPKSPCSCERNFLETQKILLNYFPSFLRVPWVLLGFSKSWYSALNRPRYQRVTFNSFPSCLVLVK